MKTASHFFPSSTFSTLPVPWMGAVALGLLLLSCPQSHGATLNWSGGSPSSGNWSDVANWTYAGVPLSGDTLIFGAGQPRTTNTNNISGLTINQIRFTGNSGGYNIYGYGIILTNSIMATNTAGTNWMFNDVTLATTDITVDVDGAAGLNLGGVLSGSVGVTKAGGGILGDYSRGSNSFSGTTRVNAGTLTLKANMNNGAFGGPLVIGDGSGSGNPTVRLIWDTEIPENVPVTINRGGLLDLNDQAETIGSLTLAGGTVSSGTATLTMNSNLTVLASSATAIINGNLKFTGGLRTIIVEDGAAFYDLNLYASISDDGGGLLITNNTPVANFARLLGSNSFTGPLTIANVRVSAETPWSMGATNGGTTVRGNTALWLYQTGITNEALTLDNGALFVGQNSNTWSGPVTLNGGATIQVYPAGYTLDLIGIIGGTGGFTKTDAGTLTLSGSSPNSYGGYTYVNEGVLQMNKSTGIAVPGVLVVGDEAGGTGADVARNLSNGQADLVVVNDSGLWDLNGFSDTIGSLTINGGGDVQTGLGMLTLNSGCTLNVAPGSSPSSSASISGNLFLSASAQAFAVANGPLFPELEISAQVSGDGGISKSGDGAILLGSSNTFSGPVVLGEGRLYLDNDSALGSTGSGTIVSNKTALVLRYGRHVSNEPLTLQGTGSSNLGALASIYGSNSWAGNITLSSYSRVTAQADDYLNLSGAIGGSGALIQQDAGTVIFSGSSANTYTNSTYANQGTLLLAKTVSDAAIRGDLIIDGTVRLLNHHQIADSANVNVQNSGRFFLNGYWDYVNGLSGSGAVDLGSGGLGIGFGNASTTFYGTIAGSGGLLKAGLGTVTLTAANTYTGTTEVGEGTVIINGNQPQSPILVDAPGTLEGSGVVGSITAHGYVQPGTSPGILTCSNLTFTAAGDYFVDLTGPNPGTGYDQLNVRGTNSLGNAVLHVNAAFTSPVSAGQQFIIIKNDGADPIAGIFVGWPEGTTLTANGFKLPISYVGGDGNDVVFTVTEVPGSTAGSTVSAGNGNHVIDPNECNDLDIAITNRTTTPMTGISAVLSTTTPGVVVNQPYSNYPDVPTNGNATNRTPFQVSTLPSFSGGSSINLQLTITSASHGDFTMPLSLASGTTPGSVYCDSCLPAVAGSITTNDAVQTGRVTRDGSLSSCGRPKTWPGFATMSGERHYDSYTLTNASGADGCVTVSLTNVCSPSLFVVAYLNAFNPADLSANYLGDAGASSGTMTFSINVPAGARCVVVVHEIDPDVGCASYTLQSSGLPCPPPTLAIHPVPGTNSVRIHWPTSAGGYELEGTPVLSSANWGWITNEPLVNGGRYNVTNVVANTNRFYRLHKPH